MASILAWRIPWIEEHGRLRSMGLQRVRHVYSDLAHSMHVLINSLMNSNPNSNWFGKIIFDLCIEGCKIFLFPVL